VIWSALARNVLVSQTGQRRSKVEILEASLDASVDPTEAG
jgi:hypothetical protein